MQNLSDWKMLRLGWILFRVNGRYFFRYSEANKYKLHCLDDIIRYKLKYYNVSVEGLSLSQLFTYGATNGWLEFYHYYSGK
jgi:hypothetical protein